MNDNPKPKHYIAVLAPDGPCWLVIEENSRDEWCSTLKLYNAQHTAALLNAQIEATRTLPKFLDLNIARVTGAAKA